MCFDAVSQCWLTTLFHFFFLTTTTNNPPHQNSPSSSFTSPSSSFSSCEMRDHSRDLQEGREVNMSNLLPFRTAHHCAFFGLSSDLVLCETTDIHRFPYQIKHELRGSNLSTHVCLHTHTHACTHTCTHRCAQVSACMHTHAHTHTHTHTHGGYSTHRVCSQSMQRKLVRQVDSTIAKCMRMYTYRHVIILYLYIYTLLARSCFPDARPIHTHTHSLTLTRPHTHTGVLLPGL